MAIQTPGKRPAKRFLKSKVMSGKFGKGRKSANSDLQLTSMVDMFTLLVIFLLANFSATGDVLFMSKEIQLPTASHGSEIERAPVVAITDNFIGLEGQKVVDVDQIAHDEILNIQALEDNLRDLKKREEFVHQLDKDHQFAGKINIQADKRTHFKIIKRVMYSCAMAGYGNINFAILAGKQDKSTPGAPGAPGAPAAAPADQKPN
jgi:biopolymer transport protein ExbD